jgi:RNA polymerase sigma-70 factor (ECF subfamily)
MLSREEIYRQYAPRLMGVCLRYVHDPTVAQDLLHDAFILIFSSMDRLRDPGKLEPWMVKITKNLCLRYLQKQKQIVDLAAVEDLLEDFSVLPEVSLEEILSMVDSLPDRYREVFRLSVLEGMSHEEIGRLLGIRPHTSSADLSRAKRLLLEMAKKAWILLLLLVPLWWVLRPGERGASDGTDSFASLGMTEETPLTTTGESPFTTAKDPLSGRIPSCHPDEVAGNACHPEEGEARREDLFVNQSVDTLSSHIALAGPDRKTEEESDACHPEEAGGRRRDLETTPPSPRKPRLALSLAFNGQGGGQTQSGEIHTVTWTGTTRLGNWWNMNIFSNAGIDSYGGDKYCSDKENIMAFTNHTEELNWTKRTVYAPPVSVSLLLRYDLTSRWEVSGGLSYTFQAAHTVISEGPSSVEEDLRAHYLGIPLRISRQLYAAGTWQAAVSTGIQYDIPLRIGLDRSVVMEGNTLSRTPLQAAEPGVFSLALGGEVQWALTPSWGLQVSPELRYYPGSHDTVLGARPLRFVLPVGMYYHF